MSYDDRWLTDVLARGHVRLVGGRAPHGPPAMSERAFMQAVRRAAIANNYMFYHTFDSRRSAPGFCDCVLAKPGQPLLLVELKVPGGVVTLAQQRWLDVLGQVTRVEVGVWTPDQWTAISTRLQGKVCDRTGHGSPLGD